MKHIFIVNKISGKGIAYKNIPIIEKVCKELNIKYKIEVSEYKGHIIEIVNSYNDKKNVVLYAVGGDGTFLEVLNNINNEIEIGLLPCGSGNDFYRYFGGVNSNFYDLVKNTILAKPIKIDCGLTNYMKFANTTSLGIDAKINYDASMMIRKSFITKGPAYILSIIKNVIVLKSSNVKMFVDDKDYSGQYYIISLMNGHYYGNGVNAAPEALIDDGFFDLVLFKKSSRLKVYKTLVRYLNGKANESDGIKRIHCKKLIIDSNEDMICQSDGENYLTKHLEVKMLKHYIKLKVTTA